MTVSQPDTDTQDIISMVLPAEARYLRLARMAAAALAGDLGFSLQEVEDVRVAVDELCAAIIEQITDRTTPISLAFTCEPGLLVASGRAPYRDGSGQAVFALHPVAREVLKIVATDFSVSATESEIRFRVEKRGGIITP